MEKKNEDVVFRMWPRYSVLEALKLGFRTLMILGLDSCKPKVVAAPTLPTSQDEDTIRPDQARSRTVPVVKTVHPCRVKSFRKAVSTVMDKLGNCS